MNDVLLGIMIPFLGTTLGAGCVFFLRGKLNLSIERGLTGFAAGIMVAASFFSLLIPALNETTDMGKWGFVPPVIGFGIGMGFLLLLDHLIPHLHMHADKAEGPKSHLAKTTMMVLAVTLHNIPEGNHGNCRHRCGQQEKYKYDAALTDSDHQRNPDIQGNI